jgi:hypothetical protein
MTTRPLGTLTADQVQQIAEAPEQWRREAKRKRN